MPAPFYFKPANHAINLASLNNYIRPYIVFIWQYKVFI